MTAKIFKWTRTFSMAVSIALLAGCATLYDPPDPVSDLKPGASKVQVSAALGAPARIVTEGDREAWLYCRKGALVDRFIATVFKGSRLENVRQAREFNFGTCDPNIEEFTLGSAGG